MGVSSPLPPLIVVMAATPLHSPLQPVSLPGRRPLCPPPWQAPCHAQLPPVAARQMRERCGGWGGGVGWGWWVVVVGRGLVCCLQGRGGPSRQAPLCPPWGAAPSQRPPLPPRPPRALLLVTAAERRHGQNTRSAGPGQQRGEAPAAPAQGNRGAQPAAGRSAAAAAAHGQGARRGCVLHGREQQERTANVSVA